MIREIEKLGKIKGQLAYRPHKVIKENFYYYQSSYFINDKDNETLLRFLRDLDRRDYFSKEYTGYGLDIIDEEGNLHETLSWTKEGWIWFKETMKIGRAWNEDARLSKELKILENKK